MLKTQVGLIVFALAAALPTTASLQASNDPKETVVVLPDSEHEADLDEDFDVDLDNDVVVRVDTAHGGGFVGVRLVEMTPDLREHFGVARDAGVLVGSVEKDGPAAKAGIAVGDILTAVDGDRLDSARDLRRAVRGGKAGETVRLDLTRDRVKKQVMVTLAERPDRDVLLGDLGPRMRKHAWVFRDRDREKPMIAPFRDMGRMEERLDELEKRLKDLEKKLPSR